MSMESVHEQLRSQVGQQVHQSDWVEIAQERIDGFAEATNDHQWIHVDPARAKAESPYGGTIAHGFLTLSMIVSLTGGGSEDAPRYPGVKMGVNYGLNRVRFPAPVMAGARIRATAVLKSVEEVPGGLQTVREVTVEVESGGKPCCVAEQISRLYF